MKIKLHFLPESAFWGSKRSKAEKDFDTSGTFLVSTGDSSKPR